MNGEDQPLPVGRYIVGNPRPVPFLETGYVSSYIGANNIQQNRTLSGRMPTTKYNSAIPNIRATEENNGGTPQIVSPADTGTAATCQSLGLYFEENGTLWVTSGLLNGSLVQEQEIATSGSGYVLARTTINGSTGAVANSSIITATTFPNDTLTVFYFAIGFYNFSTNFVRQDHCGGIYGYSCRVQFSNPARFSWRYYS